MLETKKNVISNNKENARSHESVCLFTFLSVCLFLSFFLYFLSLSLSVFIIIIIIIII